MKLSFFLIMVMTCFLTIKASDIVADSSYFKISEEVTEVICKNNDTVFLDLDRDNNTDLKIWKYAYTDSCLFQWWIRKEYLNISILPQQGNEVLLEDINATIFPIVNKLNYGDPIDTNGFMSLNYNHPFYIFLGSQLGVHCEFVEMGWDKNSIGYFAVRKKNIIDTSFYLVKIIVSDDAHCFQLIPSNVNTPVSSVNSPKEELNAFVKNNKLCIENNSNNNITVTIYSLFGTQILEKNIFSNYELIDIGSLINGIYLVSINDIENKRMKIVKIIK